MRVSYSKAANSYLPMYLKRGIFLPPKLTSSKNIFKGLIQKSSYDPTSYEMMKIHYASAGYKLPRIIYWNLRAEIGNVTASAFDENVVLVSGFSPTNLKDVLTEREIIVEDKVEPKKETPYEVMMRVIEGERYSNVTI